jgi:flagellar basal body rod protein FlgG
MGFDKIGYQRKEAVVSSFAEMIGIHALSETVDDKVGRIAPTKNPLDFAINGKGYFQVLTPTGGINMTRDGRFQLNKAGELVTLTGDNVLSDNGMKIKFPFFPEKLDEIKVNKDGVLTILNKETGKMEVVGTIGVASKTGERIEDKQIVQSHVESSNVDLATEFMALVPYKRNFEANARMYTIQKNNLSRVIQQLGS